MNDIILHTKILQGFLHFLAADKFESQMPNQSEQRATVHNLALIISKPTSNLQGKEANQTKKQKPHLLSLSSERNLLQEFW